MVTCERKGGSNECALGALFMQLPCSEKQGNLYKQMSVSHFREPTPCCALPDHKVLDTGQNVLVARKQAGLAQNKNPVTCSMALPQYDTKAKHITKF